LAAFAVVNSDDDLFVVDGEGLAGGEDDITLPVVMAGATESFRLLAQLRAVAEAAATSSEGSGGGGAYGADCENHHHHPPACQTHGLSSLCSSSAPGLAVIVFVCGWFLCFTD
jgi:hypothetical protein